MSALLNLLAIIAAFSFTIWLVRFPEKKYLKGRRVWGLAIWEFRIEFPNKLWLLPTVGILQLVFSVGTVFWFTSLFGKYFAGTHPIFSSQLILLMIPVFFLGFVFPVGVVEMITGWSIGVYGRIGKNIKNISIADEFKKIGVVRVISYLVALLLMFVASLILERIYV